MATPSCPGADINLTTSSIRRQHAECGHYKHYGKTMASGEYVFDDTRADTELARLRAIEAVFDPPTQSRLQSTGLSPGWQCLEIGPGAGSVMHWLADRVGPEGRVVAVEINPRFLDVRNRPNIEVLKGDLGEMELGRGRFDLIHGRYVLLHLPGYPPVLKQLLQALRPGGWLVLEEPDFSAARPVHGPEAMRRSVAKVNRAIARMYQTHGIDHAMGLKLPGALKDLGVENLHVENDAPIAPGGSGVARMMRMSADQLEDKYLATGEATLEDIVAYRDFAENPETRAVYYSTIAVVAQRPAGRL
jgi:SAM-dependent methyltransferase